MSFTLFSSMLESPHFGPEKLLDRQTLATLAENIDQCVRVAKTALGTGLCGQLAPRPNAQPFVQKSLVQGICVLVASRKLGIAACSEICHS
jgi:hypothetical protein